MDILRKLANQNIFHVVNQRYKQVEGALMGSLVFSVVAKEVCTEDFELKAQPLIDQNYG